MSAIGRNVVKIVVGSVIGTAVGLAVNRMTDGDKPGQDVQTIEAEGPSAVEKVKSIPDRVRGRWEAARDAGLAAQAAEEARLRTIFRQKVNDPDALTDEAPAGSNGTSPVV